MPPVADVGAACATPDALSQRFRSFHLAWPEWETLADFALDWAVKHATSRQDPLR